MSPKAIIKCWPSLWAPLKAGPEDCFYAYLWGRWQDLVLWGCWTKGPCFLLLVSQRPSSALCHVGLTSTAACFNKAIKRETPLARQKSLFCNLITAVTSPQCCHILQIRSQLQGEEIPKFVNNMEQGSLGPLRGCLLQHFIAHTRCDRKKGGGENASISKEKERRTGGQAMKA